MQSIKPEHVQICCLKYSLKLLCLCEGMSTGKLSGFTSYMHIFTKQAGNRDLVLCVAAGQSSRLIKETNAKQIMVQTSANRFSWEDLMYNLCINLIKISLSCGFCSTV